MKHQNWLLVVGLCSGLLMTSAMAGDSNVKSAAGSALGGAAGAAIGKSMGGSGVVGGAVGGAAGAAASTKKNKSGAVVGGALEARRVPHPAVSEVPRPERVPVVRSGASSASSQGIGSRDADT